MSTNITKEDIMHPKTLQEAINVIKFLQTTHKEEVAKFKETHAKQAAIIKKLENNRKKELEFLCNELHNYEISLALRTESVKQQLAEKDDIIQKHVDIIDELNKKLKEREEYTAPDIIVDSNSDSGVAMENDESSIKLEEETVKTEIKATRKCSRRFADPISFLRRVDFSPMKYKPCNRETSKKKDEKKHSLDVPVSMKRILQRQFSSDRPMSDDERNIEAIFSDGTLEPIVVRPKKANDSMNNHFSDDGSDDTSEEIFDRVMTRSSLRRSVKANPKYKKISRSKSKMLEQVKVNIVD